MQPEYEKPFMEAPEFAEVYQPCYDYRNFENAGKYRGVGSAGKIGEFSGDAGSIDTMPREPKKSKVRRDHGG